MSVRLLPGLALVLALAVLARWIHGFLPGSVASTVGEVILGVLLGLIVGNTVSPGAAFQPGIKFSFKTLLRIGIILLGASLSLSTILAIGGKALAMVVVLMTLALLVTKALARALGLSGHLGTLIGVGTSVCGNTAISATAPVIGARDEDISLAIATNTLFGTIAVFAYPLLGRWLGMDDPTFGTWAGTAVNDTSQVVATGFAYSDAAGQVATTVKLTRNALMVFVIIAMGFLHGGKGRGSFGKNLKASVPMFVFGFLALAVLRTVGALDTVGEWIGRDVPADLKVVARFLTLMALAGVGLGTKVAMMRQAGARPIVVGLGAAATVSLASLLLIRWLGPAGG